MRQRFARAPACTGALWEDTIEISNQPELDAAHAEIRAKDDALAMMAHDLRNPLAAITLSVAALRQHLASDVENSKLRESVRDHIELAESTVGAMTRMVADRLDCARIESIEPTALALD
jgi:signal transduction histidine kinase